MEKRVEKSLRLEHFESLESLFAKSQKREILRLYEYFPELYAQDDFDQRLASLSGLTQFGILRSFRFKDKRNNPKATEVEYF